MREDASNQYREQVYGKNKNFDRVSFANGIQRSSLGAYLRYKAFLESFFSRLDIWASSIDETVDRGSNQLKKDCMKQVRVSQKYFLS